MTDIALITAVGTVMSVVSSLIVSEATHRKLDAEAQEKEQELQASITKQATDLLIPYREELVRQKQLQEELHGELKKMGEAQISERHLAETRYRELSCRFEKLRQDYEAVVAGAWRLVSQLQQAGIKPEWTPGSLESRE